VWKDFRGLDELQHQRDWRFTPGRLLAGSTLGVVGLGAIGTAVAERARAFGMRVVAIRRSYTPGMTSPVAEELGGPSDLPRLLAEADVVVLSAPETPETDNLIGADELALMKPGSVLCNVARGSLVDETALIDALSRGRLRAAILDVVQEEPLPPDSALWKAPNLYLSPHSAPSQDGYFDRLAELFARNVLRYAKGEPLINLASPDQGY
jgi:phosphoglycerate dehydrogenase-like enzyme